MLVPKKTTLRATTGENRSLSDANLALKKTHNVSNGFKDFIPTLIIPTGWKYKSFVTLFG